MARAPATSREASRSAKLASRHTPTGAPVRSGGGYDLNKMKKVGVNWGSARTNVVNPAATDQLGQAMPDRMRGHEHLAGNSAEPLYARSAQAATPMGNQVAAQTAAKPGGSRTVMRSGSQGLHGAAVPDPSPRGTPMSREILGEFGPERSGR